MAHLGEVSQARRAPASRRERRVVEGALTSVDARAGQPVDARLGALGRQPAEGRDREVAREDAEACCSPTSRRAASTSGAKRAIYDLIHKLAAQGLGVLLISSELEEVLGLAHRVLVVRPAGSSREFAGGTADEETVMRAAFGERRRRDGVGGAARAPSRAALAGVGSRARSSCCASTRSSSASSSSSSS